MTRQAGQTITKDGLFPSARRDRVRFRTGLAYGVLSLPLVLVGTRLQADLDRSAFTMAFGAFLIAGALFLILRPRMTEPAPASRRIWVAGAAISLLIGLLSGFFGVGAAWPLATGALAHPLPLDPQLLGGLVAGVLVGAPLGTWLAGRTSPRLVVGILAGLLGLAGIRFLWPG